ncbi:(ZYRO0G08932g) [Zygosaccharomyces parabailii]|nr:(ZYRO0G08932g) [Zygosaccharomyces parabailii]
MIRYSYLLSRKSTNIIPLSKRYFSQSFDDSDLFRTKALINGKWVGKPNSFKVCNPSTQEIVAQVTDCELSDYEEAITAAKVAFDKFRHTTPDERSQMLENLGNLLVENKEDLARLITMENGKPISDSLGEVAYSASYFRWFSQEAVRVYGTIIPGPASNKQIFAVRQPLGVVGIMTPWNFPSAMLARKIAPALATGNTCVIKPASETPLSALVLGWLCQQAGFPAGSCNILPTSKSAEVGKLLCGHDLIKKITFTGSTRVGRLLMKQCAQDSKIIKKISMELGGNAPFIIFNDADLEKAVDGIIGCKFRQSGQTCVCANRIFVHKDVYDEVAQRLVDRIAKTFKLGDGFNDNVTHGPLISNAAVEKVSALVEDAKQKGATALIGGKKAEALGPLFYRPTVLTNVNKTMDIFHTEIFGPVASLIKFESTDEVLEMANDTDVGLAGYFYTKDIGKAHDVALKMETGIIGINTGAVSDAALPFGGVKNSGLGKEGSKFGIEDYTELKAIVLQP